MFLTETSTRHSILTKKKHFREKGPSMMQSNATKLIRETNDQPVDVDETDFAPIRIEEGSDDEGGIDLSKIPVAKSQGGPKRDRSLAVEDSELDDGDDLGTAIDVDADSEGPPSKRRREVAGPESDSETEEDKKKMAMDVSYEGFAIYGRVLCLVVKKTSAGLKPSHSSTPGGNAATGQAKMENWISSTQMPAEDV